MKILQFLFLIFRRGSLNHSAFDFEEERRKTLSSLPNQNLSTVTKNNSKGKSWLMNTKVGYSLIANFSYLKHARDMNIMLFVSPTKQVVYIRILKSASTSMLKELIPNIDKDLASHSLSNEQIDALAFRYLKKELTSEEQRYPKFALVRNPFHRIVSVYLDLFDSAGNHFSYESYWFGILKSEMTFPQFVDTISQVPDFFKGPHFAPQHYILANITSLKNINYFRIDKDQEALKGFLTKNGITLDHQNKHIKPYQYMSFYDLDLANKVYTMYKEDVLAFNYKDEYQQLLNFVST